MSFRIRCVPIFSNFKNNVDTFYLGFVILSPVCTYYVIVNFYFFEKWNELFFFSTRLGNFSTGTSPQDIPGSFNDAKVRRTLSCPEIKKNSPSTIFASTSLNKPPRQPVPEENEDNDDTIVSSSEMETNGNDTSVNVSIIYGYSSFVR